jgi:hypothetical protein
VETTEAGERGRKARGAEGTCERRPARRAAGDDGGAAADALPLGLPERPDEAKGAGRRPLWLTAAEEVTGGAVRRRLEVRSLRCATAL